MPATSTPTPPGSSSPVVRRARPDELDAVGDLTAEAYVGAGVLAPGAGYLDFLRDAAHRDREAEVWVALDGDRVVGTVTYVEPGSALVEVSGEDEAEMRSLAVDPAATGRGIGEILARHAVELARQRGFAAIVLSSSTTMHAARRLYERLGFTRLPERDWVPVPEVQLLVYRLPLTG
ncbi:GNAT family N-acetyltransferase [Oryzobacter terrae]|uniref:GNAT family N-acetyltransferase n=1 Tax=Oryzobacter terrae TaxID=1620385 RepID=UPI0036730500